MAVLEDFFSPRLLLLSISSIVLYVAALCVYRLYISPIAKFPGPKLGALTLWYEFYFDVIKKGQYTWEIGKMHDHYGA